MPMMLLRSYSFLPASTGLAEAVLDEVLTARPVLANELGDHWYDARLDDLRPEALEHERRNLSGRLGQLEAVDVAGWAGLAALGQATALVRDLDPVTVPDDPVEIVEIVEIHRGVANVHRDPPDPLEPRPLPTYYAVSPTPADWPLQRVASYYREYNWASRSWKAGRCTPNS